MNPDSRSRRSIRLPGFIIVGTPIQETLRSAAANTTVAVTKQQYIWRPSEAIAAQLPADFSLSLECRVGTDNIRRFSPTNGIKAFLIEAALGGSVLLSRQSKLNKSQKFRHHAMRLFYQLGPVFREHLCRTYRRESDLYRSGDGSHVLPEILGLDREGNGEPWKPLRLIMEGREGAVEAGIFQPKTATCIRFGLLEAARRNPLSVTRPEDGINLVRLGLFDLGPGSNRIDEAQIAQVQERLLHVMAHHLGDDTDTFNAWFFEEFNNIVHAIAKKKHPGGPMRRELVRQALLEIVFRAYRYIGDCLHAQMKEFCRRLPKKLNARERAIFNFLFLRQAFLGDLPLVLLHDRFDFLREIIIDLFDNPVDHQLQRVLLRLLQFYGDMTSKKRQGDRAYKRQRHHRNDQGRSAAVVEIDENLDQAASPASDWFQEIAGAIRELQQAQCRCKTIDRWRAEFIEEKTTPTTIVVRDTCERCDHTEARHIPRAQFAAVGSSLINGS